MYTGSPLGGSPLFCVLAEGAPNDDYFVILKVIEIGHELPEHLERLVFGEHAGVILEVGQVDAVKPASVRQVRIDKEHQKPFPHPLQWP